MILIYHSLILASLSYIASFSISTPQYLYNSPSAIQLIEMRSVGLG